MIVAYTKLMRFLICFPALSLALALALAACDDSTSCTAELRSAIEVYVESPDGLPVDAVTATQRSEIPCDMLPSTGAQDAGDAEHYNCSEQSGGTYVVRVTSGDETWSQAVDIEADECHTTERKTLTFVLDPALAD